MYTLEYKQEDIAIRMAILYSSKSWFKKTFSFPVKTPLIDIHLVREGIQFRYL